MAPAAREPFPSDIDIAARGWDHDAWCGDFFPLDLPKEWRLTFYANHFRSVLVPARTLLRAESVNLADWRGDTHEEFRFFLEITARLVERFRPHGVAALLQWLDPLADRIAGLLLLGFSWRREPNFVPWLEVLSERFATHTLRRWERVNAPLASTMPALSKLRQCWHPGLQTIGQGHSQSGRLGVMLKPADDLLELRRHIEAFMRYARQAERAALCFAGSPPPLHHMQQARILVELLGG